MYRNKNTVTILSIYMSFKVHHKYKFNNQFIFDRRPFNEFFPRFWLFFMIELFFAQITFLKKKNCCHLATALSANRKMTRGILLLDQTRIERSFLSAVRKNNKIASKLTVRSWCVGGEDNHIVDSSRMRLSHWMRKMEESVV